MTFLQQIEDFRGFLKRFNIHSNILDAKLDSLERLHNVEVGAAKANGAGTGTEALESQQSEIRRAVYGGEDQGSFTD
jgi:hypothetical protein